jgi:hypoxanthine-guanine phosphoribosyltransferase
MTNITKIKPATKAKAVSIVNDIVEAAAQLTSSAKSLKDSNKQLMKHVDFLRKNENVFVDADNAITVLNILEEVATLETDAADLLLGAKLVKTAKKNLAIVA